MHQLFWSCTVALLLSPAAAFYPYTNRFPIHRVAVQRDNKYNVVSAAKPSQPDSAGVNEDGTDFTYFASMSFGEGKQSFNMLVDSGASNTWVMSSECTLDVCTAHNTFGTEDSSTLKVTGKAFGITYGTGSVEGVIGSDTAHFAGLSVPLTFGLGQNVSTEFMSYPMDGIVGLGRGDSTEPAIDAPTFMDALKSSGAIKTKLYGLNLWRASDGGTNNGEITFGFPDSSKYSGSLSYVTTMTNSDGFWEIPIGEASVNGKSLGISQRSALIDSGTSFILMPSDDAQKLHSQIQGSYQDGERYSIPCDWKGTVSITFNGVTYDISYKDVVYTSTNDQCISNIVGRQTFGPTQWLVGDVFLKNVYSVFDFDGNRMGFGKK
ncbi:acid protease, partial [Rhizodiscina lignyota]